jgi:plasmid stabilization system protein ParE
MKVQISEEAELDLADGYWFYEGQEEGLGSEFRTSIKADIKSLKIDGGSHSKKHGYPRKICQRFPFSIFYRMESKTKLIVIAVFHQRRGKNWIAKRLGRGP